jgi:hypothetical protein
MGGGHTGSTLLVDVQAWDSQLSHVLSKFCSFCTTISSGTACTERGGPDPGETNLRCMSASSL